METYGMCSEIFCIAGKKALVTGGTKGLGKAIVTGLLENGCDVFVTSRNVAGADELQDFAEKMGRKLVLYSCDVTKSESVKEMVNAAKEQLGRIDILINSAGNIKIKPLKEMDDDSWNNVIDTNLTATFTVIREVSKVMEEQRYGKIINMSSMKSVLGTVKGFSAYCASKGAINMLTKQVACELAKFNINCNAIAPTYIKTDLNAEQLEDEEFRKSLEVRIPLGRIGTMNDLVNLALFLVSDASCFITGQVILLDGGIYAMQ
ncbi:SDR family NAD(P)-dependent oxidoreductase [Sinanaerobacter chloroacetimidivorans]|jgi:NAD(P)-dependent dehydrogenase (short-subunit alcohol dehydrogenase family)|uniref:SDR family oxidoreductase n=1 Tax=Sinanaerobacter chloroacetimidivorans TaxID=2818044 RepID=A0A8J7W1K4_9FIRM|nr:SDR family oxidoreductase [Sinanaerobacter chloroacetimidivorans]MBR0597451.1 SDR family oxidoreductase [Sinanaerobacter chloroacetimidivorans]